MYKNFIIRIGLVTLLLVVVVAGFNCYVDPAKLFVPDAVYRQLAQWRIDGGDLAGAGDYNERILQKYVLEGDSKDYDVIVLGSSRTMQIGSELYPGETIHNYSVSGCSIYDAVAFYALYRQHHQPPKKVILGIDVNETIIDRNVENRWQDVADGLWRGKEQMGLATQEEMKNGAQGIFWEKYKQLVSFEYFKASLNKYKEKLKHGNNSEFGVRELHQGEELDYADQIFAADGSRFYSREAMEHDETALTHKQMANEGHFTKYRSISEEKLELLTGLIKWLQDENVEVIFCLAPYHPDFYKYMQDTEGLKYTVELENYIRRYAKEHNVKVYGSSDPGRLGLGNKDFTDAYHPKREAYTKILREIE